MKIDHFPDSLSITLKYDSMALQFEWAILLGYITRLHWIIIERVHQNVPMPIFHLIIQLFKGTHNDSLSKLANMSMQIPTSDLHCDVSSAVLFEMISKMFKLPVTMRREYYEM